MAEQMMAEHVVDWVDANGVSLRYRADGAGPHTVVLVHEMGGTLDSWDEVVPFLSAKYRVLRYDMRGFGLSEKICGTFTVDDALGDLTGFIDAMGVTGPVALAGCAVGAGVSIRAAAARPGQVKALVAMAPAVEVPPERRARSSALAERLAKGGVRRLVHEEIAPNTYPPELRTDPERFRRFLAQQSSTDMESFIATNAILLTGSYRPYFDKIACPTLVVAGRYDKGRTPEVVREVAEAIPGARFQVVESGHFMALQTPELVGKMIADFLAEAGF